MLRWLMKSKKWKLLLDLLASRAGIAFASQVSNDDVSASLRCAGKALEAQGRFGEAATVRQGIAKNRATALDTRALERSSCTAAWKRDGDCELPEEARLKLLSLALTAKPFELALEATDALVLCGNVVNMWDEQGCNSARPLLLALMCMSGIQPPAT